MSLSAVLPPEEEVLNLPIYALSTLWAKKALKLDAMSHSTPRQYRELRAKNLLIKVIPNATIEKHLPEETGVDYRGNEEFILTVIYNLVPDHFKTVATPNTLARVNEETKEHQNSTIEVDKFIYDALFAEPFKSGKYPFRSA